MSKILLLEDDKDFNETLEDFLEEEGFMLDCVLDPYSALDLTYENNYDLYLFDVNLPYENGFKLLEKLRDSGDKTPTIFITSRSDKASLKKGFMQGGDDYLTKPVDLEELLLRIIAVLRRQTRSEVVILGDYTFDILDKMLYQNEHPIELTQKVKELLLVFIEGQGRVVSSEEIKSRLWSSSEEGSDGALRVYITQLKKIFPTQIQNIRGVGYQMIL
ncbi:DNA-binding response regulator [hydrothermal vent metagenome]|uniref:DNA-binding response regulator n=1 Tax=hydrothermal vent metagenome TaxID=652676 RepID=A0A1W1CS59_9ZZZZ